MNDAEPSDSGGSAAGDGSDSDPYRIAVAIGNPDHAEQLVRTAVALARERDGEVFVVGVIPTPRESPFALFEDDVVVREFGGERQAVLDRAVGVADGTDVPVDGKLYVAPSVARGVLTAIEERDCDGLVVGWQQRRRENAILGSNVDRIVRRAACDVLVENIGPTAPGDAVESVLLPVATGENADLAVAVARAVARATGARVDLLRVVGSKHDESAAAELLDATAEQFSEADVPVETEVHEGGVADVIVAEAESHDVTVLGATRSGAIRRRVVGSTPQEVGRRVDGTVILAKKGDDSLVSRVFRL